MPQEMAVIDNSFDMKESAERVKSLFEALASFDLGKVDGLLHPDAKWINPWVPGIRGKRRILAVLGLMKAGLKKYEIKAVYSCIDDGELVCFERREVFSFLWMEVALDVSGVFHVENGSIKAWRDYFDWTALIAGTVVSMLMTPLKKLAK